jgi:hypothetical protein
MFMESTNIIVGDFTKPHAQQALHALSKAMEQESKIAIARFVWRANATAPKIVALLPSNTTIIYIYIVF